MSRASSKKTGEVRQIFPLRLSASEKNALKEKAKDAGLKLSEYLRKAGLRTEKAQSIKSKTSIIPNINRQAYLDLAQTTEELRRIGINVNQIAKACNTALKIGYSFNVETETLLHLKRQLNELDSLLNLVRANLIGLSSEPEEDDDWEAG
jgi:hypothetical protein